LRMHLPRSALHQRRMTFRWMSFLLTKNRSRLRCNAQARGVGRNRSQIAKVGAA
jgi:hypothetical protein